MRTLPALADLPGVLRSDRPGGTSAPVWLTFASVFVVAWVVVGVDGGHFVTVANLQNIAQRSVALGLVTVGQALVVLAGSIDLSVAYVVSVSAMVTSVTIAGSPGRVPAGGARAAGARGPARPANGPGITPLPGN